MSYEHITNSHPSERVALARLCELMERPRFSLEEYTFDRLCDLLHPNSRERFALALADLVRAGGIRRIVRVVSPRHQGGIGDFASLEDVPPVIHDWRSDLELEVRPENLQVLYLAEPNVAT